MPDTTNTYDDLITQSIILHELDEKHKQTDKSWSDVQKAWKKREDVATLWDEREKNRKARQSAEKRTREMLEQYRVENGPDIDTHYYSVEDEPTKFTVDNPMQFLMRVALLHPELLNQIVNIDSKAVSELMLDGDGNMKPVYAMIPLKKTHDVKTTIHWSKLGQGNLKRIDLRNEAAQQAQAILNTNGVIIDTETTGLGDDREVVSICIADSKTGKVLFNSLVKPTTFIDPGATAVHGITLGKVADKPTMDELAEQINAIIKHRPIIGYNVDFDAEAIRNSSKHIQIVAQHDVMPVYAKFAGNQINLGYRNHKLSVACTMMGIPVNDADLHSAAGDVLLTLALLKKMAEFAEWQPEPVVEQGDPVPEPVEIDDDHPTEEIPVAPVIEEFVNNLVDQNAKPVVETD